MSTYYTVFSKKPKRLVGVAGIHTCGDGFNLCWFGRKGKKGGYQQLYTTPEDALSDMADLFGGAEKLSVFEVDFNEYFSHKGMLR